MYDEATKMHLLAIEPKHHSLIREKIEEQLQFEPSRATRNRKPLSLTGGQIRSLRHSTQPGKFVSDPITASVCCMALTKNVGRSRSRPSE
jgi:hypothetical protein